MIEKWRKKSLKNGLIDPKPCFSPACCFSRTLAVQSWYSASAPVAFKSQHYCDYSIPSNRIHWQQALQAKAAAGCFPSLPSLFSSSTAASAWHCLPPCQWCQLHSNQLMLMATTEKCMEASSTHPNQKQHWRPRQAGKLKVCCETRSPNSTRTWIKARRATRLAKDQSKSGSSPKSILKPWVLEKPEVLSK